MNEKPNETEGAPASDQDRDARSVGSEVELRASPDAVWRALTDAREIERWFALEARVDPGVGGTVFLSWKNEYEGSSEILVWNPPFHLRVRWVEGAEVTDYFLEPSGDRTLLRVVSSFPLDPEWDEWVEGTRRGWRFMLASLRLYLEDHAGADRQVVYLRRRVSLSAEDLWGRLLGPGGVDPQLRRGRILDEDPPGHLVIQAEEPPDTLLQVSVQPTMAAPGKTDATIWHQGWKVPPSRVDELRAAWRGELERLLPEGEEV